MSIVSGTFEMVAAGPLEMVASPEKGTPGVRVYCKYIDGPNKDQTIEWIGWLSEKTSVRTGESLANMGYDGEDPSTVTRSKFQGVTEEEEYTKADGSTGSRPRLKWINGTSRMVVMSGAELAGAKDRLKAAMLAAKAKAGNSAAAESEVKF